MAARQRNNIARLDYDQREMVRDWLADGLSYDEIRTRLAAILKNTPNEKLAFHGSSFLAYQKSEEYKLYLAERRTLDAKIGPKRMRAALISNGRGIESAADVAAMDLLEQIEQLSGSGLEVKDAQKLAAAIVSLKRTTANSKEKALQAKIETLQTELDAEKEKTKALEEENAELKEKLKCIPIDNSKIIEEMDKFVKGEN